MCSRTVRLSRHASTWSSYRCKSENMTKKGDNEEDEGTPPSGFSGRLVGGSSPSGRSSEELTQIFGSVFYGEYSAGDQLDVCQAGRLQNSVELKPPRRSPRNRCGGICGCFVRVLVT